MKQFDERYQLIDSEITGELQTKHERFRVGNLEVAEYTMIKTLSYSDAKMYCFCLGEGWRIPTYREIVSIPIEYYICWNTRNEEDYIHSKTKFFIYQ